MSVFTSQTVISLSLWLVDPVRQVNSTHTHITTLSMIHTTTPVKINTKIYITDQIQSIHQSIPTLSKHWLLSRRLCLWIALTG